MTDLRKIDALIEAVEVGQDDSEKWRPALGDNFLDGMRAYYHGSLDAAKDMHDTLLPDWDYRLERHGEDHFALVFPRGRMAEHADDWEASPVSAAHAWLLAMLRAYRDTLEANHDR